MLHWTKADLQGNAEFFKMLGSSAHLQIALMSLESEQASGEFGTDHPDSDQAVYVLSGRGKALIGERTLALEPGDLVVIQAGEKHQLIGDAEEPFKTLNIYCPIAYPDEA